MQHPITSHLSFAHSIWKDFLKKGDHVIDATCGNGHDSFFLANCVLEEEKGSLICLDLQEGAIANTKTQLLPSHLNRTTFHHMSHETFPETCITNYFNLIVYNLGYLPGGDKSLTTLTASTLPSLQNALTLIKSGGMISIMCYPGHAEGAKEETALLTFCKTLPSSKYTLCHHRWLNRPKSPSLILILKNKVSH